MSGVHLASRLWMVLAMLAVAPLGAQGPKPATSQSTTAKPVITVRSDIGTYQGPCPARVTFTGIITIPAGSKKSVTYQWVRSDKSRSPKRTAALQGSSLTVTDKWQGGAPGEMMRFWQELQVLAPIAGKSRQVEVGILCR